VLILAKVNIYDNCGLVHKTPKKIVMVISLSLMILSVCAVGLPLQNAWASTDFDSDNRIIISQTTTSEAFSDLPLEPEQRTITGNNDGTIIDGTSRDDTIIGTSLADTISGRNGDDVINGATGSDTIEGNDGDDTIQEADLSGQVYGNDGNDVLSGGFEPDYLSGGSGDDELYGGDQDDTLRGGSGTDYFDCGFGFDIVLDFDASEDDTHSNDCEVIYED
jgi:Ca2+-binding RTX toxin-like protein